MAAPAIYLAFAIVVLGSLCMLAEKVSIAAMGTFNRGTLISATLNSAEQNMLSQIRVEISANPAAVPTLVAFVPPAAPGVSTMTVVPKIQAYANTALGGTATAYTQNVESDSVKDTNTGAAAPTNAVLASRYAVQLDVNTVENDNSHDDAREVCTVRTYQVAPYADIVSCTPRVIDPAANSQVASDISGIRTGTGADTSAHEYDACNDPSGSGACSTEGLVDRSGVAAKSGTVTGASSW